MLSLLPFTHIYLVLYKGERSACHSYSTRLVMILLIDLVLSIGSVAPPTTQRIYTEADLSDLLLGEIAKEIGKDWKMLSRHLGLPEYEIQSINQAYMFDLHEASFQALLR